jgi:uncharacterized Zn finger protein
VAYGYYGFAPYVPVHERRRRAARKQAELRRRGHDPKPIEIAGRLIATTFWGKAWCDHLESFADFASRLPRGRTYVRNGSVIDLQVAPGELRALVSGGEIYEAHVRVEPLALARWKRVRRQCSGQVGTIVELLSGKLSSSVMEVLCHREKGLFPGAREIRMSCSCPDGAWLCKHLAAVLYGVGARLDEAPELLFTLRGVDGGALVAEAGRAKGLAATKEPDGVLADHLGEIFGIELEGPATARGRAASRPLKTARSPRSRRRAHRSVGKAAAPGVSNRSTGSPAKRRGRA